MLNFLVRKDVRKIIKRKDSDAGERGRALDDLRAALFNEFRSSEAAKHQQQQLCGPATALTFNFVIAVGIIFVNKLVLKVVRFQFPIFLTFIHYIVSWLLMAVLNALSILSACPPKSTRLSTLFTLGFVMALSTGLANGCICCYTCCSWSIQNMRHILLGNYYLFSSNPGKTSISGAFTAIAGVCIYTYLNLKQQLSKAPRQASSLPKSKLSNENGSIHEGNYGSESV